MKLILRVLPLLILSANSAYAQVIPIDTLKVTAENRLRNGLLKEFYSRAAWVKKTGIGHIIDKKTLERYPNQQLPRVLATIPGVGLENGVVMRPSNAMAFGCSPSTYLDGVPISPQFFEMLNTEDLEGVEVYNGRAQTPVQYQSLYSECGIILAWSALPKVRTDERDFYSLPGFLLGTLALYFLVRHRANQAF